MAVADIQTFKELLDSRTVKTALFVLPPDPSEDEAAAALSLSLALEKAYSISGAVSCPSPVKVELNRLVGVQKIRQDLGDKNLLISFVEYPADNVERVAYNIENGQFTLTVIPKPGKIGPKENQVNLSYTGVAADMVIIIGANYQDLGQFTQSLELEIPDTKTVLLGNAPISGWKTAIELIDPTLSSFSEVAIQVIKDINAQLDQDMATNLFLGLENGTQNFSSKKVSHQTFAVAAELLLKGAQRSPQKSEGSLPYSPVKKSIPSDYSPIARDGSNIG